MFALLAGVRGLVDGLGGLDGSSQTSSAMRAVVSYKDCVHYVWA